MMSNQEHGPDKGGKYVWRSFTLNISFIILLFVFGIFIGILLNNEHLIEAELETRARSHFKNIVLVRKWNAQHGGVYVEKKAGIRSNPYLENPDIEATDGTVYTKKNPALMTREISELSEKDGGYRFHITSLNPVNPDNVADEFERKALKSFENGAKEVFGKETESGKVFFRYMGPLYTENSCLECHGKQGYKVGDVRGGISVKFDITDVKRKLMISRYALVVLFVITAVMLMGIIYLFIVKLRRKLLEAQKKIEEMAVTDELTQLRNRRYFFTRLHEECERAKRYFHSLSCIMLDIDFFKHVNDKYGHESGDLVLQAVSEVLKNNCRTSDVVARYGGEEFVEILTETGLEGALTVAERIRSLVESKSVIIDGGTELRVTVSLGVVSISSDKWPEYADYSEIIKAADKALYRAKENGRNRVETA